MELKTSLTTRTSTPKLSDVARHVVIPSGIVSTGWPAVSRKIAQLGGSFDSWQEGAAKLILAKRADGSFAASIGGVFVSIPRQVGKTHLLGFLVFALCLLHPGLTVLWTAHQLKTANETFRAMQGMAKRQKIAPHIGHIRLGSGDQAVEFVNGSRILFGARDQGFGLGFAKVDIVVLDEAQRVTEKAMDDMIPATNQSEMPGGALVLMTGTPPRPTDTGEVFKNRRAEALAGQLEDALFIELSADPETNPALWRPGFVDWEQVARANPSFPARTSKAAILRMFKLLGRDSFRREGLGIWDEATTTPRAVPAEKWAGCAGVAPPEGVPSYGVKFSVDGLLVSLAVCSMPEDGLPHVELVEHLPAVESARVVDWLTAGASARWRKCAQIVVDGRSGSGAFVEALLARKVPATVVVRPTADQYTAAHKMFLDAVEAGGLTQFAPDGEPLALAVAAAIRRTIGTQGGWGWGSMSDDTEISPLDAVTLAHWGAKTSKRKPGRKQVVL